MPSDAWKHRPIKEHVPRITFPVPCFSTHWELGNLGQGTLGRWEGGLEEDMQAAHFKYCRLGAGEPWAGGREGRLEEDMQAAHFKYCRLKVLQTDHCADKIGRAHV